MEITAGEIQAIIEGCIRNDIVAQKKLYNAFYPYAMHVCLPYTYNEEDSNDILSNAFMRIFKSISEYDSSRGSFFAWVRKIVVNASLDFIKQRSKFAASTLDEAEGIVIENTVIDKLSADELLQTIRSLPPATQAVFNLYCIEGYNHREIAVILDIKEGTSKWHLSEAKALLRKRLLNYEK